MNDVARMMSKHPGKASASPHKGEANAPEVEAPPQHSGDADPSSAQHSEPDAHHEHAQKLADLHSQIAELHAAHAQRLAKPKM